MQIKGQFQQINLMGPQVPQIAPPTLQVQKSQISQPIQSTTTMKRIDKFSYDVNKTLGSGSYSDVYFGTEEATGKKVAIKVMNLNSLNNDFVYNLILSEMTTMKSFKHKNIVQLYEVFQTANNLYMVLEYCNQGDLRKLLNEKKRLSELEATKILYQIVQGYQDILHHHIIHRDMKPENILINDDICKIADFGFAKALANQNEQMISVPVGTPLYCSPQVMEGQYYTVKTDVWSLGIMYYEMLYGTTPWPCSGFEDLKQQMAVFPYVRYPNNRAISPAAFNFLHNALQFEESKRIGWEEVKNHEIFIGIANEIRKKEIGIKESKEPVKNTSNKEHHKHHNKKEKKEKQEKKEKKKESLPQNQINLDQNQSSKGLFKLKKTEGFFEEFSPKRRKQPLNTYTQSSQQQLQQQQQQQQQNMNQQLLLKQRLTSPSQRYKHLQYQQPPVVKQRPDSAMPRPQKYQSIQFYNFFS